MQSVPRDKTLTIKQNIEKVLISDPVLYTFSVVPLDYRVVDKESPTLYISKNKLIFTFDEVIEIYNLQEIDIEEKGGIPKFTLWEQYFEETYQYTEETWSELRTSEFILKMSINENQKAPKYFVLREYDTVQKNYKTWAMMQTVLNIKNGVKTDPQLEEMLVGSFASFNRGTVLMFGIVVIAFFVLRIVLGGLADFINTVLDVIFILVLAFMTYWLYASMSKNLKKFENIYKTYKETKIGYNTEV